MPDSPTAAPKVRALPALVEAEGPGAALDLLKLLHHTGAEDEADPDLRSAEGEGCNCDETSEVPIKAL